MKLSLNIYKENSKEIEKTYYAETVDFSFGIVEDIINVLKVDEIDMNNKQMLAMVILKAMPVLKPLLMDIFEGLTDEECRRTRVSDVIGVFKGLYRYATEELGTAAASGKN